MTHSTAFSEMHAGSESITTAQFRVSPSRVAGISAARGSTRNRLLDALPDDVWERLKPNLARVSMSAGQVLHEPGATRHDAYFPCTSIVDKIFLLANGLSCGVGIVGCEGMVGVSLFLGGGKSRSQARCRKTAMDSGFSVTACGKNLVGPER